MRPSTRKVLFLALLLVAPVALAGCIKDIRQQNTRFLLFLEVWEEGRIGDFGLLDVVITHVRLKPNDTRIEPVGIMIGQTHDLVTIHEGAKRKLVESDIPYRLYDEVAIGVNVTNAALTDGTPVTVAVPPDNIYYIRQTFKTLLAGDVAYTFGLGVERGPNAEGIEEYYIRSVKDISGAGRG